MKNTNIFKAIMLLPHAAPSKQKQTHAGAQMRID